MIENKILSLDLGSNSIGAAIRNLAEENQFEKTTVITFETGVGKDKENKYTVSLAANRTSKRSIRRLYQSRKYKLWAVLDALIRDKTKLYCPISEQSLKQWKYYNKEQAQKGNGGRQYPIEDIAFTNWIKLDFNNDGIPDNISPYQLRNELSTRMLDFSVEENRFKLGRALYHIAQHRGFKSSKIVQSKDDAQEEKVNFDEEIIIGAEKPKQEKFQKEVEKLGFDFNPDKETVGMLFAKIETEGIHHPERKTEGIRIRKNLHQFVTRKMLIKEVKHIFDFQGLDFKSIFHEEVSKSAIFWQRPLRSQKGTIGICTLENHFEEVTDKYGNKQLKEVGKKKCPISRPEFEEFRALSFINNIQFRVKGNKDAQWKALSQEMRNELFKEKFFVQKDFEFYSIYNWIKNKNGHDNWELNYNFKTNVSACVVSARLQRIFGEKWNSTLTRKDKNGNAYAAPFFEDIWHILFENDDEDSIVDYAREILKLSDEQTAKLRSLWFAMPAGYTQLSLKAINNILPFLREGFIYTDAVLLGKVPEILGKKIWEKSKTFIVESLQDSVIKKNREEKRMLNIVNNLIAQYKALPKDKRFADKDFDYTLGSRDHLLPEDSEERDNVQILKASEEGFEKESWENLTTKERENVLRQVKVFYQQFFNNINREFYRLPRLDEAMKKFLSDNFSDLLYCPNTFKKVEKNEDKCKCERCKLLNRLYHPSMIAIYPEAKEGFYKNGDIEKRMVMLGSPKTGAFKNPMAMRTLHELKKFINYLIATSQVDEETRVIVEIPREANLEDNNRRYAYTVYQQRREEENKEFANAIRELLNDPEAREVIANADSASDIDKFRLWYEMIDSSEGFEKSGKFTAVEDDKKPIEKKKNGKTKKNNVVEAKEEFYEFSENHYENIRKEVWLKLKKAKDNVIEKYRLWKEQQFFCMYTGKPIRITDLFKENLIDIEHTIPRSVCFDNSLANKTVCYADFNRNIKKNQIPYTLNNYNQIKRGLERWEQKVKDIQMRVEFWKGKSKKARTKEDSDNAIREKHLWQFELDYWKNKVERFTMKEVKPGFKNSQLKDTQLISKYALHYLKSFFNQVDVQKGEITAEFRKVFNIQETGTKKDRTKHSHHAKDAVTLSIIPVAAIRDKILDAWFKIDEQKKLLQSSPEKNKAAIEENIRQLQEELEQLKYQCRLPKGLNGYLKKLDDELLINNVARNRSVIPASKKIRINGKSFIAKGHAIRGELHKATFYGKIREVERDEFDKPKRNDTREFIYKKGKDEFSYVLRTEVDKNLNVEKIVDPHLKKIIVQQMNGRTMGATLSEDGGLYMLKKDGGRAHKIRHIRCYAHVSEPIQVKSQTIQSSQEHKNYYWATNGENVLCALFQKEKTNEKPERELEIISLKDIADLVKEDLITTINDLQLYRKDKRGNPVIDENGQKQKPYAILKSRMKVIFYDEHLLELNQQPNESLSNYAKRISYRTYTITKFTGGRITFQHHTEARTDAELQKAYSKDQVFMTDENGKEIKYGVGGTSGFTRKITDALKYNGPNNFEPWPKLLYSVDWLNMAIEGLHFNIEPDGGIKWKAKIFHERHPINRLV
jgi:CRISPR-associated endonuclease Csn1